MVRTGEVRPNNNLTGAYARNLSHKDNVIFVRFFILKKALAIFYPFDDLYQRDFYIAGILKLRKHSAVTPYLADF